MFTTIPNPQGLQRAGGAGARVASGQLNAAPFPSEWCDALFQAILIDDEVDDDLRAPGAVQLDHTQADLLACFRLCRQLWMDGYDRAMLGEIVGRLLEDHDLGTEDRLRFKHIRAKFKHLRYAHALYGAGHRYPFLLDQMTIAMGHVQDACRNRQHRSIALQGRLLRLLLSRPSSLRLKAEANRLTLATPTSFRALLELDQTVLEALLTQSTVTGPLFHAARKVVGRQVSFWDTLRTIRPSADYYRMSRWLSAINGTMGELHDRLIERRAVAGRAAYEMDFVLPDDIRGRIETLNSLVQSTRNGTGRPHATVEANSRRRL